MCVRGKLNQPAGGLLKSHDEMAINEEGGCGQPNGHHVTAILPPGSD